MSTILRTLRNLRKIGLKVRIHARDRYGRQTQLTLPRNMATKCRYASHPSLPTTICLADSGSCYAVYWYA